MQEYLVFVNTVVLLLLLSSCHKITYLVKCLMNLAKVKVAQSCLTLCNLMDYTVHGIL